MHYATRTGNEDVLAAIMQHIGPGAVQISLNKQSKSGWTPMLEACDRGHVKAIEILLSEHARVDVFDDAGKTGLHLAAANGHIQACETLLKHKVSHAALSPKPSRTGVYQLENKDGRNTASLCSDERFFTCMRHVHNGKSC
jgi:ankyrin repeat protein